MEFNPCLHCRHYDFLIRFCNFTARLFCVIIMQKSYAVFFVAVSAKQNFTKGEGD